MVDLEKAANTKVVQYSKGMRMRLTFARSLINKPEILFLDEPTSGLDPVSARMIKDLILDLKSQGKTVFLTTHNMAVADELCDRVAFIVDGEIKLIDSPRNLKINKGKRIVKVEYAKNGSTGYQEFPLDELKDNKEFLTLIQEKTIETIHTEEASLEKIFIETTGRRLE
jgi:fluoroquinolone transport system ATP-binding protein